MLPVMIQLLFSVLTVEASVVVLLLVKTPIRKLVTLGLDRLKRGRGPVMVKTLAGALFVMFGSSLYSMQKIGTRSDDIGSLSATDQVLWSRHLLEASLMGNHYIFITHVES